jgi:hypothetical protein
VAYFGVRELGTAKGGKNGVNDRSTHMAMGFIYHLLHSFPDCFSSVVARNYFHSPIRYACVFAEASKTRVKVAHYRKLCHMLAIYHAYYNFCRVHQKMRVTPAMEAGLTDHVWSLEELVGLLEQKVVGLAA